MKSGTEDWFVTIFFFDILFAVNNVAQFAPLIHLGISEMNEICS